MTTTTVEPRAASFEFCEKAGWRGTNFLHAKLVGEALRLALPDAPTPRFTEEEITAGFARGEQLIWFPAKDADGAPITMERLYASLENKAPLGGKLLCDTGYEVEALFSKETARAEKKTAGSWRLVGMSAILGTKGENYLRQTVIGATHVRDVVFGGSPPETLRAMLAEPEEREEEIEALVRKDWQKGAKVLASIPFNRQFRETPIEALIRVIVNQRVNKTRVLVGEYSWTPSCSRDGGLVSFGDAGADGASLRGWNPQNAYGHLGFFLSRSDTAKSES